MRLRISLRIHPSLVRRECTSPRSRSDSFKRPKDDARKDGQDSRKYGGQSSVAYLSAVICKCDDADRNALYCKCCLSINGEPVYVLFDTGAGTGKLIIGIYRNLSEVSPIISDNFIGSDKFIG